MVGYLITIWKYTLGSFHDDKTKEYDNIVCILRTGILLTYLITNIIICAGVLRHWNDGATHLEDLRSDDGVLGETVSIATEYVKK